MRYIDKERNTDLTSMARWMLLVVGKYRYWSRVAADYEVDRGWIPSEVASLYVLKFE